MANERPNAVTFRGNPLTLLGSELKVGDRAPDFVTVGKDLKPVRMADTRGTTRIFSSVPSLDTPVCDAETRRFSAEASGLPNVKIYTISMDLPFAQSRWAEAAKAKQIILLSDHKDGDFGLHYGTLIKELRLDSRAVFVVGEDDIIRYVEYVPEITEQPNFEAALAAIRQLVPQ